MIVSVGILAHNEAEVIHYTIRSFFSQSVFSAYEKIVDEWEVICVANGCDDATASVAREAFKGNSIASENGRIAFRVEELAKPGKSNAWNEYIHLFSRKDADALLLMDADIAFHDARTIKSMVTALLNNPSADVVVDSPLKDVAFKKRKSIFNKLSIETSKIVLEGSVAIAGSLYLGRASVLNQVWMPEGLPGEDGFLRSMVITDMFRKAPDAGRVIRATNASHIYKACATLQEIYRHELRLVLGTCLNCYLTWDCLYFATDPKGPGAGALIKNRLASDPGWYHKLMHNQIMNHGWWKLPHGMLFSRFNSLKGTGLGKSIKRLPLSLIGFLFNLPIYLIANRMLKKDMAVGFW